MNATEFINWLKTFEHFTNDAQYEHIRPDYKFIALAFENLEGCNAKTFLDAMHYPYYFELNEDMMRIYKFNWKETIQFLSFAMPANLYPRAQYLESQAILEKLSKDKTAVKDRCYGDKVIANSRYKTDYEIAAKPCGYSGKTSNARRAFVRSQNILIDTMRQNLKNELAAIDEDENEEIAFLSKNAFAKTERLTEDTYVIIQNWIMKNFA